MMIFKIIFKNTFLILVLLCLKTLSACQAQNKNNIQKIVVAANNTKAYVPLLKNKKIAIVANPTSVIFKAGGHTHLVDSLLQLNIRIQKIFCPEHGFRGNADAGQKVLDSIDIKTGLPIISLYGKYKKPRAKDLKGLDVVVFDIQDVGARFYTYISTLHYVMEACAENDVPVMVLDRPNPNGHYVDGPMLNPAYRSFVGIDPVPLVYGMTIGEYAKMINKEGWLKNKVQCDLSIIRLQNYHHGSQYHVPIKPSPNLPNDTAINLYPSLGFFEGTPINAGRGTRFQFQRYGSALFPKTNFNYVPKPNAGSKYPKDKGKICYGVDLRNEPRQSKVNLKWLVDAYQKYPNKKAFFGKTFTVHAGDTILEHQLKKGLTAKQIEDSWKPAIKAFKKIRKKYLMY